MEVLSRYHWIGSNMRGEERKSRESGETSKDGTLGNKHIVLFMVCKSHSVVSDSWRSQSMKFSRSEYRSG